MPTASYAAENTRDGCARNRGLKNTRGFTMIEILIGASVLAVGLLGLATIYPVAYLNVDSGGKLTEATALAQSFMEELRTMAVIGPTNFDTVIGDFPPNGFNGMSTTNCQGNQNCINWRNRLDVAFNGPLPQGVGTITITCTDGAGNPVPAPPPNDCTAPSQFGWIATVDVTVNWNDLRGARTVTIRTMMVRP